ncbi:N-acetylmuramidase domain-containing protein [Paracoccus sp. SSJ]|nr:N-acetylmuramidase domain-containing protein [Paracoccus sp. SSJ]MDK8874199.1 N-acetylmuramidase domain-containing protein [Paracoccus sp. SSJ]
MGQILGSNHKAAGFATPGDMVEAFCHSEAAQLEAMISFIISEGLDDELRRHDWSAFARRLQRPGLCHPRLSHQARGGLQALVSLR